MSHNRYLMTIGLSGILSWIGFGVVVQKLDPFQSTGMALGFFFVTLFLALLCTFAVIGYYFRVWLNHNEIYYKHINVSLRQGVLLSLVVIIALGFQLLSVLTWWTGLLLVFAIMLIEFYFTLREK